jgi:TldD protein
MKPYIAKDLKPQIKVHPRDISVDEKRDLLVRTNDAAKENGERISSTVVRYGELYGNKIVVNSEGTSVSWDPLVLDLRCMVVSKGMGGGLADGADGIGGTLGFERITKSDRSPESIGKNASLWAKEKLSARSAPAGEFRALCEHMLTGVLAHESFGHLTEGDFVISKSSPLAGKVGEKLGSEQATIVDEGPMDASKHSVFWLPVDDQGVPTGRTVLLDKGVFKGYLHSRVTASALGDRPSGNARAINFCFPPIPRMTNTYFTPGDMTEDEAIRELGTGIYAIRSHGGQVNMDGTFLFKAARGYWVENGEIKHPLKDVVLMDSILNFIKNVEGATKVLELNSGYFGGCGKGEQYPLPVGDGGPDLLLSKVRFGGEAK